MRDHFADARSSLRAPSVDAKLEGKEARTLNREMEERFWVERPADLVALPTPHRSEVAAYNDAAKLVIITAIVLAALRFKAWAIVLAAGLALVMFVYYNRHPRAQDAPPPRDERKGAMFQTRQHSRGQRRAVTDASVEPFTRLPLEPRPSLIATPTATESKPARPDPDRRFRDGSGTRFDRRAWAATVTFVGAGRPLPVPQPAGDTFALRGARDALAGARGHRVEGIAHNRADEPLLHYYDTLEEDRAHIEHELAVEEQTNESTVHG
jgi:hypothetical protein